MVVPPEFHWIFPESYILSRWGTLKLDVDFNISSEPETACFFLLYCFHSKNFCDTLMLFYTCGDSGNKINYSVRHRSLQTHINMLKLSYTLAQSYNRHSAGVGFSLLGKTIKDFCVICAI